MLMKHAMKRIGFFICTLANECQRGIVQSSPFNVKVHAMNVYKYIGVKELCLSYVEYHCAFTFWASAASHNHR